MESFSVGVAAGFAERFEVREESQEMGFQLIIQRTDLLDNTRKPVAEADALCHSVHGSPPGDLTVEADWRGGFGIGLGLVEGLAVGAVDMVREEEGSGVWWYKPPESCAVSRGLLC